MQRIPSRRFDIEKIREIAGVLIKNIYWEQSRSLMPYDSTTYILPYASKLKELLKLKSDGTLKRLDKRGYTR